MTTSGLGPTAAAVATAVATALLVMPPPDAGSAASRSSTPAAVDRGVIQPTLMNRFEDSGGEPQDFWITFDAEADTSGAIGIDDWAERGQFVYDKLRETAKTAQAETVRELNAAGVVFESHWITNSIRVESGTMALAQTMAAQAGVDQVIAPMRYEAPEPVGIVPSRSEPGPAAEGGVEWGIANIKADQVWDKYGTRGEGIVVANIDTGVHWEHPALANSYRGNNGDGTIDNDYNWFDVTGTAEDPADVFHGTFTMGIMVGDDGAGNRIGVAPGAQWIAANGCANPCDSAEVIASAEWMLAPTRADGTEADPAMRPHIINNSWGRSTGRPPYDPFLLKILKAWAHAGIFSVWANGNEGPKCESSRSPGSQSQSYSVGAIDVSNQIADMSSRGSGQDGEIKPNISAPGIDVRSSVPPGASAPYGTLSGTSYATPHVAGSVALLWAAAPDLIGEVKATRRLLDNTAIDTADLQCGGTADDNNVYGEGRLDALALVDASGARRAGGVGGLAVTTP